MATLTAGALAKMVENRTPGLQAVLQVINFEIIAGNNRRVNCKDRYRLLVSDGEATYSSVMLATQLNTMIKNNEIDALCVVRVITYYCNTIQDKCVLTFFDLEVLKKGSEVRKKLGKPTRLKQDVAPEENAPPPQQDQPPPVQDTSSRAAPAPARSPLIPVRIAGGNNATSPMQSSNSVGSNGAQAEPGTKGPNCVHKIATLTPYQNRWRIRARVTQKSNIRTWSSANGKGRLFNVNFLDESGKIRATGFNNAVADKFYDLLKVNKEYYVSRCSLKPVNEKYRIGKIDYEMSINNDSVIEECKDEGDLPSMTFDFVPINEMKKHPARSIVDVIGVVKVCNDLSVKTERLSQRKITKRDLQIVDQSGVAINMTLWGNDAQNFDCSGHPVMAVKGASLSYFGGRSLSVLASSQMIVNPDIREAHILREWYDREGTSMDFSNWKTFDQVNQENLGQGDTADWFTKATLMHLKKDKCMYQACPTENCNKKLVDQGNGMWHCEKCQREFPNYKWCMSLQATLSDFSGHQWVTSFQESAETLLGVKADELGEMRQSNEAAFDQVFQQALFKDYVFKLRAKVEVYNEESRLKTVCVAATPVDYTQYGKHLVEEIHRMEL